MTTPAFIPYEAEAKLDWLGLTDAFVEGHQRPKAEIADSFLYRGDDTLLNRAAWIDGLGLAVKSATIFPGNQTRGLGAVNGGVSLYADDTGLLEAVVDFHLITKWKTAGDSLLGALRLARPDSKEILIVGAGHVGHSLFEAYSAGFPGARFKVWNRTIAKAEAMAEELGIGVARDLETAVGEADIVTSATMSTEPLIRGDWLQPGQHLDLIGAYRPDMREADDAALQRARVFVDSRDTTFGHIGELKIPLESGAIRREQVLADYYAMDAMRRESDDEITLFKNGGGAHLDLMTSRYVHARWLAT
ncbi:ornithine cyclodeaminase family protein [Salipiger bermudensis]|uniref:Ornithine cyclodeaminase/mu-crystallin family protein n=1 Tax=Salipiger bermudensis (strain DSM 26914 / JCM 13377 / KCTC 12554 / HTCC2601) TaxID=314265 RepID=Q0FRJ9_SALBH|nr:NAD(P)-binding domain-containing protein [Salipiger bermudensis]EAU46855.1 ornithine cyclodeaminase/mu-crystallin family protein [Salipiger bermudensis HTCC2601]